MPKDRLLEFQNAASNHGNADDEEPHVSISSPLKVLLKKRSSRKSHNNDEAGDNVPSTFLKDIEWLTQNLDNLCDRVSQVKKLHSSILSSPSSNQELKEKLDVEANAIRNLSNVIQKELKGIDDAIKKEEKENEEREKAGERKIHWANLRIKKAQYRALMQRFRDGMVAFSDQQLLYRQQCKKRIQMGLQIANQKMTEEEVNNMIENQDPHIFSEEYVMMASQAKLDLQELEERHEELLKLEKSLVELKDLFSHVALLVNQQGDLVDRVEDQMEKTKEFVESSVQQTNKALISQRKANKRKICLISCGSIFLIFLVLMIVVSIKFG